MDAVIMALSVFGLICTAFLAFFVFEFVRAFLPNINNYLDKSGRKKLPRLLCIVLPVACALAVLI